MITETSTIAEAKAFLRSKVKEGECCPVCSRHTQMYVRKITSSMSAGLILIYRWFHDHGKSNEWLHIEQYFKSLPDLPSSLRGDVPKLRFWGLIQPRGTEGKDGNPNDGYYKITDYGRQFVECKVLIPSSINVYNNKMYGFAKEGSDINIRQALKNKFNYDSLMKNGIII